MAKTKQQLHDSSKAIWVILALVIVILAGALTKIPGAPDISKMEPAALNQQSIAFDFGNQKIMLDQQELTFANGAYKSSDEHHTARITHSSVNKSGKNGAAILVDNPGGSGTFFYVVGASNKDGNEIYSKPVLLGDRVSIVSVNVEDADTYNNGMITVTYLDRSTDASEASAAKKETTKQYAFQEDGNVIEVLQ